MGRNGRTSDKDARATQEQVEAIEDSMNQLLDDYPEKTHRQEQKSSEMNLGISVTTLHDGVMMQEKYGATGSFLGTACYRYSL